jgi:sulfur carrier protein
MKIVINGESKTVSEKLTVQQLIQELGIEEQKLALEVNEEIVPRSTFSEHLLQPGDIVEIIHAIGGG